MDSNTTVKKPNRQRARTARWYAIWNEVSKADREQRGELPNLSVDQVLAWADAFFARNGDWPTCSSGPIPESPGETWRAVEAALVLGLRGFPHNGSLPRLFARHRGRYNQHDQHFSIQQILVWAEDWRARTGRWPGYRSGKVPGAGGIKWQALDFALRLGRGGLPGGSSLHKLLIAEGKLVRPTPLTAKQILAWADAHHARTGKWPREGSGRVFEASGYAWSSLDDALRRGTCGLPGGSSLFELLVTERGARAGGHAPALAVSTILAWADAFHARTGRWPLKKSGPVPEAPGETWRNIESALRCGSRGLPAGSSLARLLARERGKRNIQDLPPITVPEILQWADDHHNRHGTWPKCTSGPIPLAPSETWMGVSVALRKGRRDLPRTSLRRLLSKHRGVKCTPERSSLTAESILAWCDAHHARAGMWPTAQSGPIPECPGATWAFVDYTLRRYGCGLSGGSSLPRLLAVARTIRNRRYCPMLTIPQIRAWAEAHLARTGQWPKPSSGDVLEADGESWRRINDALRSGQRGLPGGSCLRTLYDSERPHEPQPTSIREWQAPVRNNVIPRPTVSPQI